MNEDLFSLKKKKMALCETCGSFLVANDATERTQSHMTGKQHIGFGLVREYIFEYHIKKKCQKNNMVFVTKKTI